MTSLVHGDTICGLWQLIPAFQWILFSMLFISASSVTWPVFFIWFLGIFPGQVILSVCTDFKLMHIYALDGSCHYVLVHEHMIPLTVQIIVALQVMEKSPFCWILVCWRYVVRWWPAFWVHVQLLSVYKTGVLTMCLRTSLFTKVISWRNHDPSFTVPWVCTGCAHH